MIMAEAPTTDSKKNLTLNFIAVPSRGKKKKHRITDSAIVFGSLNPTIPIVVPEVVPALQQVKSAPSSPSKDDKKKKGFLKRPKSPLNRRKHSNSDPERTPSPSPHRPNWLHFRHKSKSPSDINGGTTPVDDVEEQLTNNEETLPDPTATPVDQLPGKMIKRDSGSCIPVITVSHSSEEEAIVSTTNGNSSASFEDELSGTDLDPCRKMSQSSHHSGCHSIGTSGVGSLLSPSGDECSDLESPLSPLSRQSSSNDELSDNDPIERDLRSPSSDHEGLGVTTPTTPRESPPPTMIVGSPSTGDYKELKTKKKKDKQTPWDRVKNVVKAWSPFAVQFKKKYYPWVQLAGHEGNFRPGGENGTIMKKSDINERNALKALMCDELRLCVPEFKREVEKDGDMYVEMTDLLREFDEPAVMDVKMGMRTYLEEELEKARTKKELRKDMYQKMIDVDPNEPTEEEHVLMAITKPRYMQWRESLSSTSNLGFRIEGIKTTAGKALKDFKTTKSESAVTQALSTYISENPTVKEPFLRRLECMREALERSEFMTTHEVIGSSLLFVYDSSGQASIHMIDFGKTIPLPSGITVNHRKQWIEGNHEDGYLWGLDNLIDIWRRL